ncbi:uncharacterized protein LOC141910125 [Tubulanus polymorphus]|uniref:uncharacterized protein LOC141910125 n=1 Tax=Tubulanus polymorphus TaxID=672921 RepID=UPI003DA53A65
MYDKADLQTATLDHDYLEKPLPYYIVERTVKQLASVFGNIINCSVINHGTYRGGMAISMLLNQKLSIWLKITSII